MPQLIRQLRCAFTLVPWRLRPKLIGIAFGSLLVALLDVAAVLLLLPVMKLAGGASIASSDVLRRLAALVGTDSKATLLFVVLLAVIALMLLKNVGTLAFRWWSLGIMAHAQADASETMLRLFGREDWESHRTRQRSDTLQVMNGYIGAAFATTGDLIMLAVDLLTATAIMLSLVVISPLTALVALVFFGGSAWLLQFWLRRAQIRLGDQARQANIRAWFHLTPAIEGFRESRIAGANDQFAADYAAARRDAALANRALGVLGELPRALLEIVMIIGILLVAVTLLLVTDQSSTFALLGVFAAGALRIVPSINRAVATLGRIRSNLPNTEALEATIIELHRRQRPAIMAPATVAFPLHDIRFDHITYSFPDADSPVLSDVSGVIPTGHTVALVGASGAGKSTFIELLLGLLTPKAGAFTVAGVNIHDHPQAWWKQLGVVAQDVFVMPRSIRENVAFGCPADKIDDERVMRALRLAQLEDVLAEMPEGIDTVLGESGTRVSGGQKQRIGIARALYREPQVLVLDEATSALDNETEHRITETIRSLRGQMTIIVVAHRLSTVKHADQILFFSGGHIAARGTMSELIERNAEFANLVKLGQLS